MGTFLALLAIGQAIAFFVLYTAVVAAHRRVIRAQRQIEKVVIVSGAVLAEVVQAQGTPRGDRFENDGGERLIDAILKGCGRN